MPLKVKSPGTYPTVDKSVFVCVFISMVSFTNPVFTSVFKLFKKGHQVMSASIIIYSQLNNAFVPAMPCSKNKNLFCHY